MAIERSKLVDKSAYLKWYNLAKETVEDTNLVPERTKEEIFNLVSKENWLLFGLNKEDKEIATYKPEPNVFFDILSKEGNLTGFGRLGLIFNNLGAYDRFKTIMRGTNQELKKEITSKLLALKYTWTIKLNKKIKRYNYAQTPEYSEGGTWSSNDINEEIIEEVIKKAEEIKEQGISNREEVRTKAGNPKKFYTETPTISLMEGEFELKEEEFKDRILEIFNILSLCLNIKSDVEIKKIQRQKIKELTQKRLELERINEELPKYKKLVGVIPSMTDATVKQKESEKEKLESSIEKLESEIE